MGLDQWSKSKKNESLTPDFWRFDFVWSHPAEYPHNQAIVVFHLRRSSQLGRESQFPRNFGAGEESWPRLRDMHISTCFVTICIKLLTSLIFRWFVAIIVEFGPHLPIFGSTFLLQTARGCFAFECDFEALLPTLLHLAHQLGSSGAKKKPPRPTISVYFTYISIPL